MRVALITPDWPAFSDGGVATLAAVSAAGLTAAGLEVEVWTRGGGWRDVALAAENRGRASEVELVGGSLSLDFRVVGLPGRAWRRRGRAHWASGLGPLVERFDPDIMLVSPWDPLPGLWDALPRAMRSRVWVFAHGREITADLGPERNALREEVFRLAPGWLCLTRWLADALAARGVAAECIQVVPAAVAGPSVSIAGPSSIEPIRPSSTSAPLRCLTVGRLVKRKGHERMLRALALRPELDVHYDIVGEGRERLTLERLVDELGLEERVTLHGHLEMVELDRVWASADLFVMLPRASSEGDSEGFGLVYLEAASRGIASLGTRSGGAAEAIEHGVTGLQLPEACGAEAVAQQLAELSLDRARLLELGGAARERWRSRHRPLEHGHVLRSLFEESEQALLDRSAGGSPGSWVVAVRAALPSPRPQGWQATQQALGLARAGASEVHLLGDFGLPDGGPEDLASWLGHDLPSALLEHRPRRWRRPPGAGLSFRHRLARLRSPDRTLLCRDPRVAAAEQGRWGRLLLEWHVRPDPSLRGHRKALRSADLHLPVSEGLARDLVALGVPAARIRILPNACGLSLARAQARVGRGLGEERPVLALGLHRRSGIDQALDAWRDDLNLPPLWIGGRDQGAMRTESWARSIDEDPRLQGRVRLLGPVWGEEREDLLDQVGAWLCLYPVDEDSPERLCPLQVADAAGAGLPLVASDLPSIRRLLERPQGGRLSPGGQGETLTRRGQEVSCGKGGRSSLVLPSGAVLVDGCRPEALAKAIRQALDGAPLEPLQRPRWVDRAKQLMSLV